MDNFPHCTYIIVFSKLIIVLANETLLVDPKGADGILLHGWRESAFDVFDHFLHGISPSLLSIMHGYRSSVSRKRSFDVTKPFGEFVFTNDGILIGRYFLTDLAVHSLRLASTLSSASASSPLCPSMNERSGVREFLGGDDEC
jgi:hypothetical protein